MYRFYTHSRLTPGSLAELDVEELHHLRKVLRVRNGERIELVNGKGQLATAIYADLITIQSVHSEPKSDRKSVLIQALPEKTHLEFILEKGTEIGITEFWFFPSERSKIDVISDALLLRMKKITISAIKQCKRLHLPSIYAHHHITDFKEHSFKLYLADPKGTTFHHTDELSKGIIVGPESGFTQKEIDYFQTTCKAIPTTLSPNILRAETAAIVASYLICS